MFDLAPFLDLKKQKKCGENKKYMKREKKRIKLNMLQIFHFNLVRFEIQEIQ
jgi:hypothetical protein